MDAKVTLSFDKEVIDKAKKYAESQNISLSRLTELLLRQITTGSYKTLEGLPVSDWVNQLVEGNAKYVTRNRSRKSRRSEYYNSRK
ncbi:MAG: DUF6364 family protein [Bacteroidales bacterium]